MKRNRVVIRMVESMVSLKWDSRCASDPSYIKWPLVADADWLLVKIFNFWQSISDHQIAEDLSEERKEEERNYFEVIFVKENQNAAILANVMMLSMVF